MTSNGSVKKRRGTAAKIVRHDKAEKPPWARHNVHITPDATLVADGAADVLVIPAEPQKPRVKSPASENAHHFHVLRSVRHAERIELKSRQHSSEVTYPLLLTPITTAFTHSNASASEIARIGREVKTYVTGNWERLAGDLPIALKSTKIKVIRGCAVVISAGGCPEDLDKLTIDDFAWISTNLRSLTPHAEAIRSITDFRQVAMVQLLDQESSSAARAISAKRSAKSR
jgi:hypothetical protein